MSKTAATRKDPHGRQAKSPAEIPMRGWLDIGWRLIQNVQQSYLDLIAAGVAFYYLLALFPALAAAVSMYGLFLDPRVISAQIEEMSRFVPPDALAIISTQTNKLVETTNATLSVSFLFSLALALFSATKGMSALIKGFNVAYKEKERRGFFKLTLINYSLTVIMMLYFLLAVTVVAGVPIVLHWLRVDAELQSGLLLVRWPILFVMAYLGLEILYRYGPCRENARWRWLSYGSFIATSCWILICTGFSVFVQTLGNYAETYGSLGAVIVLLLWFWLSALMILVGAEINATIEHQTKQDTTTGAAKPMGERGAYVADTLGELPSKKSKAKIRRRAKAQTPL